MQQRRNDQTRVVVFDLPDLFVTPAGTPPSPPTVDVPRPTDAASNSPRGGKTRATPDYLVPRALARRWSVCVDKVLRFIQTGELRAFNVASPKSRRPRYRISIEEVRRFEEQTRSAAPPPAIKAPSPRRKATAAGQKSRTYF